ncbi:MAG: amidohydrolase [Bryobacterales bacterium]|nr:amidohydrolase [Bryobacterales bacterium]
MRKYLFFIAALPVVAASPLTDEEIARRAEALKPKLVETRRHLHMYPELSNREKETGRYIAERMRQIGYADVQTNVALTGVVATLKGGKPGPVVAVRADIDALPVTESLNVPYKSKNPGVKHACGHDIHMTVQLGVAELLYSIRDQIPGTIKFIFQPAEESAPPGEEAGALLMIKQGVLDNPKPAAIFGLHTNPNLRAGQIGYSSGPAMASGDRFAIKIRGKQVHAAWPHDGIDATVIASEAVLALQSIRSRRIDPSEPFVLTIGSIHGGQRFNIVAPEVVMEGTIRTLNEDVRQKSHRLMREILEGVTKAHGGSFDLTFTEPGYPVTFNEPQLTAKTLSTLQRVVTERNVVQLKPSMGSEDFAEFQKIIPGVFYWLGVGNPDKGINGALHTPEYDADEDSIPVGVRVMTAVLLDYLARGQ